jgi:hypothetical protein
MGDYYPYIIYGVRERDPDKVLSFDFLCNFRIDSYVREIERHYGRDFIYGSSVTIEDVKNNIHIPQVDEFVNTLRKKYRINFGIPNYYVCLSASHYEVLQKEYTPVEIKVSDVIIVTDVEGNCSNGDGDDDSDDSDDDSDDNSDDSDNDTCEGTPL